MICAVVEAVRHIVSVKIACVRGVSRLTTKVTSIPIEMTNKDEKLLLAQRSINTVLHRSLLSVFQMTQFSRYAVAAIFHCS